MGNRRSAGHLAALFTIIIWGTTFISTKVLLTYEDNALMQLGDAGRQV